jgi:hypothetical protein
MSFDPRTWLNWELAGNPYNYVVLTLMVALAGLFLALLFPMADVQPGGGH